jgi:LDH2 family malate/lactate/ureidoglycolate dehydrogenase
MIIIKENQMETYNINPEILREYCSDLLKSLDVSDSDAFVIADNLVDADLCGVESHGVSRMSIYMKRLETGVVSKNAEIQVIQEHPASLALSASNAMGMVAGKCAMERSIEKARESGCCFTTVKNSNHYGMSGYYVNIAAKENMIGITGTNAPPNIAPWGSYKPYQGTNPIAFAAPTHGRPIILDMAPSVVAMGKVILAAKLGKDIPEGWALTKDGKPTTNAKEGMDGTVLPIGGPKGYGLAVFVDILAGILSGAMIGPYINNMWNDFENPQDVGHFFIAVDISKFVDVDMFKTRIGQMVSEIKALPKNPGIAEIFMPGEIEQRLRDERTANGLELSAIVYQELKDLGEKYGVPFTGAKP